MVFKVLLALNGNSPGTLDEPAGECGLAELGCLGGEADEVASLCSSSVEVLVGHEKLTFEGTDPTKRL